MGRACAGCGRGASGARAFSARWKLLPSQGFPARRAARMLNILAITAPVFLLIEPRLRRRAGGPLRQEKAFVRSAPSC